MAVSTLTRWWWGAGDEALMDVEEREEDVGYLSREGRGGAEEWG